MKPIVAPGGTFVIISLLGRPPGPPDVGNRETVVVTPIWVVVSEVVVV